MVKKIVVNSPDTFNKRRDEYKRIHRISPNEDGLLYEDYNFSINRVASCHQFKLNCKENRKEDAESKGLKYNDDDPSIVRNKVTDCSYNAAHGRPEGTPLPKKAKEQLENIRSYQDVNILDIHKLIYFNEKNELKFTDFMMENKYSNHEEFCTKLRNCTFEENDNYAEYDEPLEDRIEAPVKGKKKEKHDHSGDQPSSKFTLSSIAEFFKKVINFISCGRLFKDSGKNKSE